MLTCFSVKKIRVSFFIVCILIICFLIGAARSVFAGGVTCSVGEERTINGTCYKLGSVINAGPYNDHFPSPNPYYESNGNSVVCVGGGNPKRYYKYNTEACQASTPSCGDGTCNSSEDHQSCPADCENLGVCGDGFCGDDESVDTCFTDCHVPDDPVDPGDGDSTETPIELDIEYGNLSTDCANLNANYKTFNFVQRFDCFLEMTKETAIFNVIKIGDGIPNSGSSVVEIDCGSYGSFDYDFAVWSPGLAAIKAVLVILSAWVSTRIIILKR